MWPLLTQRHMTSGSVLKQHNLAWSHWVCLDGTSPTSPPWKRRERVRCERERERGERERWGYVLLHTPFTLRGGTQNFVIPKHTHTCIHAWLMPDKVELQCQGVCVFIHFSLLIFLFFISDIFGRGKTCVVTHRVTTSTTVSQTGNKPQITTSSTTVRFATWRFRSNVGSRAF